MSRDRLIYLITKKKSGEITLDEQLELSGLLKGDEQTAWLAGSIDEVFVSSIRYSHSVSKEDVNNALQKLHEKIHHKHHLVSSSEKPLNIRTKYWLVAAAVFLIVATSIFYLLQKDHSFNSNNVITTQKGSKTDLELPDGTKVWVNADTRLSYDKNFGDNTREVTLTGEAYFDVVKDMSRPFIVHTSTMDVKVLGTTFNVRAYKNETNEQTTLVRGSVEVVLKNKPDNKVILAPNEKIIVAREGEKPENGKTSVRLTEPELIKIPTTKMDSLTTEIQWVQNRIVFDQEKLEDITPMLERWYNVKIELKAANPNRLYSGTFENDSLEDVLEALKIAGGFQYSIRKDNVIIY